MHDGPNSCHVYEWSSNQSNMPSPFLRAVIEALSHLKLVECARLAHRWRVPAEGGCYATHPVVLAARIDRVHGACAPAAAWRGHARDEAPHGHAGARDLSERACLSWPVDGACRAGGPVRLPGGDEERDRVRNDFWRGDSHTPALVY